MCSLLDAPYLTETHPINSQLVIRQTTSQHKHPFSLLIDNLYGSCPEPVYTGWSSVHWNATGWPSVHWDTTGRHSKYLQDTLEHHWKNFVETAPHWNATGET